MKKIFFFIFYKQSPSETHPHRGLSSVSCQIPDVWRWSERHLRPVAPPLSTGLMWGFSLPVPDVNKGYSIHTDVLVWLMEPIKTLDVQAVSFFWQLRVNMNEREMPDDCVFFKRFSDYCFSGSTKSNSRLMILFQILCLVFVVPHQHRDTR